MSEIQKGGERFTGYEYQQIIVPQARVSMYLDGYESFGWQSDAHFSLQGAGMSVTLHLRRDRKILNKMELTRLQRNFEASMEEIEKLERSKSTMPQIIALTTGIIGTAFMAGSTFAVTANPPIIWMCVLLAIPGVIGWALPCFIYQKQVKKRSDRVKPLIEAKYDEIYELCKKGNALLN